jgi:hypothetical protein
MGIVCSFTADQFLTLLESRAANYSWLGLLTNHSQTDIPLWACDDTHFFVRSLVWVKCSSGMFQSVPSAAFVWGDREFE